MEEPILKLTYAEICRIAEILEGRFDGKTSFDVDIVCRFNDWIYKGREIRLEEIVRIQEQKIDDYETWRHKAYDYPKCLYCGQEFCQCG